MSFYCPLELARHEWKPLLSELGSQEKTNLGGMLHLCVIRSSSSCGALATPSPTVGRVGHDWRHPPPHPPTHTHWMPPGQSSGCAMISTLYLGLSIHRREARIIHWQWGISQLSKTQAKGHSISKVCKKIIIIIFFQILFIYFGCAGSSLLHRLSLVAGRGGYSLSQCTGFSLRWLLLLQSRGSRVSGGSSCGLWALEHRLSSCGARALLPPRHVKSSGTKDRTHVPCTGRRILYHWTPQGSPATFFFWDKAGSVGDPWVAAGDRRDQMRWGGVFSKQEGGSPSGKMVFRTNRFLRVSLPFVSGTVWPLSQGQSGHCLRPVWDSKHGDWFNLYFGEGLGAKRWSPIYLAHLFPVLWSSSLPHSTKGSCSWLK